MGVTRGSARGYAWLFTTLSSYSWRARGTIRGAGDQIQVGHVESQCPTCGTGTWASSSAFSGGGRVMDGTQGPSHARSALTTEPHPWPPLLYSLRGASLHEHRITPVPVQTCGCRCTHRQHMRCPPALTLPASLLLSLVFLWTWDCALPLSASHS